MLLECSPEQDFSLHSKWQGFSTIVKGIYNWRNCNTKHPFLDFRNQNEGICSISASSHSATRMVALDTSITSTTLLEMWHSAGPKNLSRSRFTVSLFKLPPWTSLGRSCFSLPAMRKPHCRTGTSSLSGMYGEWMGFSRVQKWICLQWDNSALDFTI